MNFFKMEISEEVIENHILPKLNWNDLLRLRRVCKTTKGITDRYLRLNPQLAPEVEINDGSHSFGHFLQTGIPSTRIFINNSSGHGFYAKDKKNQVEFLRQFGPLVKHLRISQLCLYVFGDELDFLEALVNLETLQVGCIGFGLNLNSVIQGADIERAAFRMIQLAEQDPRYLPDSPFIPDLLETLKVVKIGQHKSMPLGNIVYVSCMTLNNCKKVEYALLPFYAAMSRSTSLGEMEALPENTSRAEVFRTAIQFVSDYIETRRKKCRGRGNLKGFDFDNYHGFEVDFEQLYWTGSPYFLELCLLSHDPRNPVKLMNVGSAWFARRNDIDKFYYTPNIACPVVSLVNMHPSAAPLAMPNLEKIDIRSTTRSCVGPQWREERQDWPKLKILSIIVDSKAVTVMESDAGPGRANTPVLIKQETYVLFQFFFQGILRPAMTELNISFAKGAGSKTVPNAEEIVASCPNLKKLTLGKWSGTNKALTKLWSGLPGLEEISLENCKNLGNVAFVGEDERSPVFFKLKNLRKLSLKGLDQMPKITDTLFSLVLRHVKLTHLIFTSGAPVKSVTSAGVLKLLKGGFAESIEKFPFSGWSLANVSVAEFKKLGMKFRSSDML